MKSLKELTVLNHGHQSSGLLSSLPQLLVLFSGPGKVAPAIVLQGETEPQCAQRSLLAEKYLDLRTF